MRSFQFAGGSLPLGNKTWLMGILNLTPDSFFAGSRVDGGAVLDRALQMEAEGADILDVGAVSTRPGGDVADEETELARLSDALPRLVKAVHAPVSVDTFRPAVAAFALASGAAIVNDVSGVFQPELAALVRRYGAGYIVMHAGEPGSKTADVLSYPGGVVNHVQGFFDEMRRLLTQSGLSPEQLCFDPGFGFAKTAEQNTELLKNFSLLRTEGAALLCALSRKRFIGALTGAADPADRLSGTLAADLFAALHGADILRVHDVKAHRELLKVIDALR